MLGRPWSVFILWALFLGVSLAVLWGIIGLGPIEGWVPVATFLMSILITLGMAAVAGAGAWRSRRRAGPSDDPEAIPDFSFPAVLAAISLASMALGLELGPWLILIGAGGLGVAIGALLTESRATRRAAARAARGET
jgi:hypothetical protein